MRAALLLLLVPLAASAVETRLTDSTSRYAAMLEQSPFALATAVEAPPEPTESFTANWELTGLSKLRNEKGEERDYVSIRSRDRRLSFTLFGDEVATEAEAKGVSIHSIDRQENGRKSTVMLKRGAETGKVEFSQETTPAPAAPAMNAMNPNGAAGNANQVRAMQMQQMQAQQARIQQMQNTLTFGANKVPAVVNPAQPAGGIARPATNGIIQPNGLPNQGVNSAMPAQCQRWRPLPAAAERERQSKRAEQRRSTPAFAGHQYAVGGARGTGVPPVGPTGVPPVETHSAGGTPACPTGGTPVPRCGATALPRRGTRRKRWPARRRIPPSARRWESPAGRRSSCC